MSKKFYILINTESEDGGNIKIWAQKNGFEISQIRLYRGAALPELAAGDMVAVMGGPMNIYEHDSCPWLIDEKRWLKTVVNTATPVMGICLGAQLIADAIGGRVLKNKFTEIGFFTVSKLDAMNKSNIFSVMPESFPAFEWHGDYCVLPETALLLARSAACECQAFQYNSNILGIQFHLDYNAESVYYNLEHFSEGLECAGEYIQSKDEIIAQLSLLKEGARYLYLLLDRLYHEQIKNKDTVR